MSRYLSVRDRYARDPAFNNLVDCLQGAILNMHLTPTEVREAAVLACTMVEERRPVRIPLESVMESEPKPT